MALHAFRITLVVAFWAVLGNTIFGIVASILLGAPSIGGASGCSAPSIDLPFAVSPVVVGLALILVVRPERVRSVSWIADAGREGDLLAAGHGDRDDVRVAPTRGPRRRARCSRRSATSRSRPRGRSVRRRPRPSVGSRCPAIRWALAYGVVLTLARCLGEYGAVLVVSGNIAGQDADRTAARRARTSRTSTSPVRIRSRSLLAMIAITRPVAAQLRTPGGRLSDEHRVSATSASASASSSPSTTCRWTSPPGRSRRCSGRAAAARRRCSG